MPARGTACWTVAGVEDERDRSHACVCVWPQPIAGSGAPALVLAPPCWGAAPAWGRDTDSPHRAASRSPRSTAVLVLNVELESVWVQFSIVAEGSGFRT